MQVICSRDRRFSCRFAVYPVIIRSIVLVAVPLLSSATQAAILSWSGGSLTTSVWSDSANWGFAGTPTNGDTLIFPAAQPRLANTNDIPGLTLNQIRFVGSAGGYNVNGNAFTMTNNIGATNTSGGNTINPGITLSASPFSIDVGAGATLTLAGALTGGAGVTKNGAGTLTYTGTNDNTYAGTTTVSAGLLQLNKTNGFGLAIPQALVLSNSTTVRCLSAHQIWSFGAPTTINTSALLDLNGNEDAVGLLTLNGGQVTTGAGGSLQMQEAIIVKSNTTAQSSIAGNLLLVSGSITISNAGHYFSPDLRINASIGSMGNFGFIKNGDGEVSFASSNSFFGPITVNRGSLWAENAYSFGNVTNTATVNSNGTIFLFLASIGTKPLTLGGGALVARGPSAWAGNITVASDSLINVFVASETLNLSGAITGPGGMTKIGLGTLTYSGSLDNTYAGVTTVNEGILQLNKTIGWAIGDGSLVIGDGLGGADSDIVRYTGASISEINISVPITITASGLLDLNNHSDDVGPITLAGGDISTGTGLLEANGDFNVLATNRTANVSGNVRFLGGGERRINVADGLVFYDIIFTANISDSGGGLVVSNSNPVGNFVIFRGSNSFTGPLTIAQAILSAETPWALGTTNGGTIVKSNSTLWLYITAITNESLTLNAGAQLVGQYDCTWTGPITLTGDATIQSFGGGSGFGFNLLGAITGAGNLLMFSDGGTNRMLGAAVNTYSGNTTFSAGFLDLNRSGFDASIPHDFTINGQARLLQENQINNGANVTIGAAGSLVLSNGVVERFGTLSGSGSVNLGSAPNFLVVGDFSNNGSSTYNGVISGAGDLWKDGSGTLTLTGNNTYTGTTYVRGGTLLVNGVQPASPIIIDSGTPTLAGNGTVGEIYCQGNLRPGTSPGILTCSNLTFTSAGNLYLDLNGHTPGSTHDQLNVHGTNSLANAALHISSSLTNPVSVGDQLVFIKNDLADPISGTFLGWGSGSSLITSGGARLVISYNGGDGNDAVFTVTEVPTDAVGTSVTSGNGSHTLDPNECNNLTIVITNKTGSAMTSVSAVLSTTNIDALVTQPYSAYPNIPANGKATNSTIFQISTLPSFVCGSDLNLRLTVSSVSHGVFTVPVVLHSGQPSGVPNRYDNNIVTNIPDIGTIESTNVVAGFTGPLTKVAVSLWLTHAVDSDLSISLIAPDNTSIDLSSGNGSGADYGSACSPDASRTTFDDSGASSITVGSSPFVGAFRPEVSLSSLFASPPNGNWRLRITDSFGGSLGALRCWSLFLYPVSCRAGNGACGLCLPSISGSITTNDLVQSGRLTRNGIGAGCGQPKACPTLSDGFPRHYDIYSFTNNTGAEACITIDLANSCSNNVFAAAYLSSFDPADLCANYLGDPGVSGSNLAFSVTVPAGAVYKVVVNEINPDTGCSNYILSLSGLPCSQPLLNVQAVPTGKARLYWSSSAGGYLLESTPSLFPTNWSVTADEPLISGGNYNVTNDIIGPSRFYRLHKPQ